MSTEIEHENHPDRAIRIATLVGKGAGILVRESRTLAAQLKPVAGELATQLFGALAEDVFGARPRPRSES